MRLFIATVTLWALVSAKPEMYKEKEDFQYSRSSSDDGSKSGYYGAQRGNMGGNYEKAHNMDSLAQHHMSTLIRQVDGELGEGANTKTGSVFTSGNSRGIYGSGNYDLSNLKGRNFDEGGGVSYDDWYASLISQNSRNNANLYTGSNYARHSGHQLEATGLSAGYQHGGLASQYIQANDNQQAESKYHGSSSNYQYGGQGASQYKYYSQGSSQAKNEFDGSTNLQSNNIYNANTKSRLISTIPHRIYVRPGTRVTIPIAAQTYDAVRDSLSQQQTAVNTDAEVLNHDRHYVIKPVSVPKHYESSYNYHKEWEKHDSQPISIVPTENPFPKNSELYEDAQLSVASGQQYQSEIDSSNILSSNLHNAQTSGLNSAQLSSLNSEQLSSLNRAHLNSLNSAHSSSLNSASSSGYSAKSAASNRLRYLSQTQNAAEIASSGAHQANIQNLGQSNMNLVDDNLRPKSYQSSYSYHKSWERHGDPYIIKPAGSDISTQMSQKLVADSASYGAQAHSLYGSHYTQAQDDCVEPMRHKRSYNAHEYREHHHSQSQELFGQQTQNSWNGLDSFAQDKNQNEKLEDLGQQPQNLWGDLESYVQDKNPIGKLEDLGQQTQNSWGDLESFSHNKNPNGKLEDLGQQTQNSWGDLESFSHNKNPNGKLEDLGQQTQNSWGDLESLSHNNNPNGKLEDLGQQTQSSWGDLESFSHNKNPNEKLEDLGQQTQNSWGDLESFGHNKNPNGKLEDLGQQTQNSWGDLESFSHNNNPNGKLEDLGQQTQNSWGDLESFGHNKNPNGKLEDLGQQTQNSWGDLESFSYNKNHNGKLEDLGQQTQNSWGDLESSSQNINLNGKLEDLGQQTQNSWGDLESSSQNKNLNGKLEDLGQQTQNSWGDLESSSQNKNLNGKLEDLGQQTQNSWGDLESLAQHKNKIEKLEDLGHQMQNVWEPSENLGQQTQGMWDHIDTVSQQNQVGKLDDLGQQTQNSWSLDDFHPQSQSQIEQLSNFGQETQNIDKYNHHGQSQDAKLEDLGQQTQTSLGFKKLNPKSNSHIEQSGNFGQETQNIWDQVDNFSGQEQSQIGNIENLGQQIQVSWGSDSFHHQSQSNQKDIRELGQETENTWDNLGAQVPQKESKSYDQQSLNQHTQNVWNQFEDVNSQATRNMGQTSQDNIENGNPSISTQEYVNFWNNIYNVELQKHHDESTNINQQTQNTLWHQQTNNEQAFQEHSFYTNIQHHSLHSETTEKSIHEESENNKDKFLWDMIDKFIEESDNKEKNESQVHDKNYSSNSYHNFNKSITTEKSITKTTPTYVSNSHEIEKNIGRGDIGPEDIKELSIDNNEKSEESIVLQNSPKESRVNIKLSKDKENFNEKPVVLNVIGLQQKNIVSTSTSTPTQQDQISDLNTQSIQDEHQHQYKHTQTIDSIEQQNLEQQYEFINQTVVNDKSTLDFSQQAQKPTIGNVEVLSHSNFNQLEVQSHKNENFDTKPKIINVKPEHEHPIEVTTENPGFWKSVWGKTVNVKDTVVGWFKS